MGRYYRIERFSTAMSLGGLVFLDSLYKIIAKNKKPPLHIYGVLIPFLLEHYPSLCQYSNNLTLPR
jgi:hypothetical protein